MVSFDVLFAFVLTTAIMAFVPGPAVLYAMARTVASGRRAGLLAALGIHLGTYVHIASTSAGLSALFRAMPALYVGVKLAGAAYVVWIGISMMRSTIGADKTSRAAAPRSGSRAFVESVFVEILNPTTALFFLAFLPQLVNAGSAVPHWAQLAMLGTAVGFVFTLADVTYVLLASTVLEQLKRSSHLEARCRQVGGLLLMGLGVQMVLRAS
ncbi:MULTISPECIES: LysE family translocator [unclassified Aureimonas]|uniref:LysE family translocator n=1 Tax=unclassified Aureimonas TaxID=2615206 RepID=UPI0006F6D5E4|nr:MULTISPECIES: LysE family translocator [unclassified Aureimonas]KQT69711.1 amino acid transporter [Aureimonas sp. Leaf427]KQT76313.1 amino acid transporter [Aureimonas sp. Leaf460]